jgi:hypothetical protein
MTYGVVHHFKGATKEQYEASIAAVHPCRSPCASTCNQVYAKAALNLPMTGPVVPRRVIPGPI